MKYIIMCGGNYKHWGKPRQLSVIQGETLVSRTIRLLRKNGIKDIAISSNNPIFKEFGVPVLEHNNLYNCKWHDIEEGSWYNCFYPTSKPTCYLFGDVFYSPDAIKTIVETETDDIQFFGSKPPFDKMYIKDHVEPFALKVVNQKHLHEAIEKTKEYEKQGKFWRKPIMWELWAVIKNVPIPQRGEYQEEYVVINDYTCDIDWEEDIIKIEDKFRRQNMIKCEVIKKFGFSRFNELEHIERKSINIQDTLLVGDTFECTKELADYLLGNNPLKEVVVKVIEVKPEKETKIELATEPKTEPKKKKKKK